MILSETDARTRWCPFAASPTLIGGQISNGRPIGGNNTLCIASSCMVWSWTDGTMTLGFCGLMAASTAVASTAGPSPPAAFGA